MRGKYIFLIVLYFLSVIVRIFPLFVTPIPYNVDALLDARASQFIASHGNLNFPINVSYNNHHTPVTILFNALCGALSQLSGINVLAFLPYLFPFITSFSVLGWYLLSKKITGKEEIGIFTALLFSLSGTYVLQTSLVWKEAIGLTIMPLALYSYKKRDWAALFLFFILPLTHHYVALISYLFLTYIVIYDFYIKHRNHLPLEKMDILWILVTPLLWIYMTTYYILEDFNRLSELSPTSGLWLFISLFILLFIGGIKLLNSRYRGVRFYHFLLFVPVILFYLAYFFFPIFPHTMRFNTTTLYFTLGLLLLLPLITSGMYILLTTEYQGRKSFLSILLPPLQMILFFLLRGLDLISYVSLSRTFDFLDPAINTSVGTSIAASKRKIPIAIIIFILIATTTPLAFHTTEAFGVTYFIYPQEYHAGEWLQQHYSNYTIYTDDKLGLVAHNGFDLNVSRGLPLILKNGEERGKIWLVGTYWKDGAQMSPMAPMKVNTEKIIENKSVIFSSGTTFVVLNNTSQLG